MVDSGIAETAMLRGIYRYPVKGLSPEPMSAVALTAGETLPLDRRYAIENGPSGFDPAAPKWLPKAQFLMLMRNERLASLDARFDEASHVLTIRRQGCELVRGDLDTEAGRVAIEDLFGRIFTKELRGPPRILRAPGHSFSDVARKVVSIINLSSVAELEGPVGRPVNPLRFRGNLHVSGWPARHEFALMGATLAIGAARVKIIKRIVRCGAINVDPENGLRDLDLPRAMMRAHGHDDCGVYAEVIADGAITVGDQVRLVSRPGWS